MQAARRVLVGRIVAPHGVQGLVKLAAYTEDAAAIAGFGALEDEGGNPVRLTLKGESKGLLLAAIEGVTTREKAESLKGASLFIRREKLPAAEADSFYHADLVGLLMIDATGLVLGEVSAVHDFGAGPLLEVAPATGGSTVLVPFTVQVIPAVDLERGRLVADLPEGLWPKRDEGGKDDGGGKAGQRS